MAWRSILLEVQRTALMIQINSDSYSKQQKIQKFLNCGFQKSETRQSEGLLLGTAFRFEKVSKITMYCRQQRQKATCRMLS